MSRGKEAEQSVPENRFPVRKPAAVLDKPNGCGRTAGVVEEKTTVIVTRRDVAYLRTKALVARAKRDRQKRQLNEG